MVAKPLYPLYKNIIKPLDRVRYPELRSILMGNQRMIPVFFITFAPKLQNIYISNMAIIKTVEGKTPRWGKNCFIAENAVLTGDCILGDDCSIWYSAVLRSDVDAIRCGNRVNVQDCACIHQTGTMPCILEDDVSVGHGAIVHGATVRNGALIGMNATVLDKADIGEGAIIAAGAVVTHGTKVPAHEIWAGIPARKVKTCAPGQAEEFAKHYSGYIKDWYLKEYK